MVIIYTLASNFTAKGVQAADDVEDLERSLAFYRDGLGFPTKGIVGTEFVGNATDAAGAPRTELAKDSEIMPGPGGVVTGNPHERPWGIYSGYFKDPDGHLWEVIWDPDRS